jgi:hypothetical protein
MKNEVKFGFGIDQDTCETDMFDSVDELLMYAQYSWDNMDGNTFDDCDDYTGCIFVGTIKKIEPFDVAPSLDYLTDILTDQFYCDYSIDDDDVVRVCNKEEAEKAWKEFVNKYFELPAQVIGTWNIGIYNLKDHCWEEKYDKFDKYVTEN